MMLGVTKETLRETIDILAEIEVETIDELKALSMAIAVLNDILENSDEREGI